MSARRDGNRIHGARRIVRVDDDQGPGARRDQRAQMVEIREPVVGRVGPVIARLGVDRGEDRRVQGVGGHRHEHFIALVDERVEREIDRLRTCPS